MRYSFIVKIFNICSLLIIAIILNSCSEKLPTTYNDEQKIDLMDNNDPSSSTDVEDPTTDNNLAESNAITNSKLTQNIKHPLVAISGCLAGNALCVANITNSKTPDNIFENVEFNNMVTLKLEILNQSTFIINNIGIDSPFPNSDFNLDNNSSSCLNNKSLTLSPQQKCTINIQYKPTISTDDVFTFRISGMSVDDNSTLSSQLINLPYSTN